MAVYMMVKFLLIAGVPKGATAWLSRYFRQHPAV